MLPNHSEILNNNLIIAELKLVQQYHFAEDLKTIRNNTVLRTILSH